MPATELNAGNSGTSLRISRMFDTTPERVFDAWLNPEQMSKWMGPRMMVKNCKVLSQEARVGGKYRLEMQKSDGNDLIVGGVYREIVPHSRLVFTWSWEHENQETLVTLTLRPVGKSTELTLLHENFANAERRDGHNQGWTASLDQLAAFLK